MGLVQEFELEIDCQKKEKQELDRQHRKTIYNLKSEIIELKHKSKKALRELKAALQDQVLNLKSTYLKQYSIEGESTDKPLKDGSVQTACFKSSIATTLDGS